MSKHLLIILYMIEFTFECWITLKEPNEEAGNNYEGKGGKPEKALATSLASYTQLSTRHKLYNKETTESTWGVWLAKCSCIYTEYRCQSMFS